MLLSLSSTVKIFGSCTSHLAVTAKAVDRACLFACTYIQDPIRESSSRQHLVYPHEIGLIYRKNEIMTTGCGVREREPGGNDRETSSGHTNTCVYI